MTTYHHANVSGRKLFYREAGPHRLADYRTFARFSQFVAHVS